MSCFIHTGNLDAADGLGSSKAFSYLLQTSDTTKSGYNGKETATKNCDSDVKRRRDRDLILDRGNKPCLINDKLVQDFKLYLVKQEQSPHTIRNKIQYEKRFYYVLQEENAQDLMSVSPETRQHAMKSLASLSKFMGTYDRWQTLIKKFQLKWPKKEAYAVFNDIFNDSIDSFTAMLKWVKESISALPRRLGNVIIFNTLTGLRPD